MNITLRIANPYEPEDYQFYERVYGRVDYRGKVVLDLGADVGSTADFFLQKGAARVVAVEGDPDTFKGLCTNIRTVFDDPQFSRVRPICCQLRDPETLAGLIFQAQPQVVKMDLDSEGVYWESQLLPPLPDPVLRIAAEWLVECHTRAGFTDVATRLRLAGFTLIHDDVWAPPNTSVAYFRLI